MKLLITVVTAWLLGVSPALRAVAAESYLNEPLTLSPDLGYHVTSLVEGPGGILVGSAARSPLETAVVAFDRDGNNFRVLHAFGSVPEDGNPGLAATLINGKDGYLYGSSTNGGVNSTGMIFRLKPDGSEYQVLRTFPAADGWTVGGLAPSSLVADTTAGLLYGTASGGQNSVPGTGSSGLVFKLGTTGNSFSVIKHLPANVMLPRALVRAHWGTLYGIAQTTGTGVVFFMKPDGSGYRFPALGRYVGAVVPKSGIWVAFLSGGQYGAGFLGSFTGDFEDSGPGGGANFESPVKILFEGQNGLGYGADANGTIFQLNVTGSGYTKVGSIGGEVRSLIEGFDGTLYCASSESLLRLSPLPAGTPRIFATGSEVFGSGIQRFGVQTVVLSSSLPNAKIFYTADGTPPTSAGQPYVIPFEVVQPTVLRVIAYSSDLSQSFERPALDLNVVPAWTLKTQLSGGTGLIEWDPAPVEVIRPNTGPSPAEGRYLVGTAVNLRAVPNIAYRFVRWDGAGGGTSAEKTVTLNTDIEVTAVLEPNPQFNLRTFTKGGGLIAGNAATPTADASVQQFSGSTVSLVAQPKPGWIFLRWAGDATGSNPTVQVAMDRAKTVEAVFGATVTTTVVGPGSVEILPNPGPHEFGTKLTLIGHPGPGNFLAHWGETADSAFNPLTYVLGGTVAPVVSATFTVIPAGQVLLTVNVDGPGFVSANPARNTFVPGGSVTLTATPAAGEVFRGWSYRVGDQDFASPDPVLSLTVTAAMTATARFGNVPVPPVITTHPQPVTVIEGAPATFSVVATGGVPLTYQWRRGETDLPEDGHFNGVTTATLTINQVNASDAGGYTVEVSNASGSVTSNPAILTVLESQADTDGDGLRNGEEGVLGTNPTLADTDGDGLNDFREARELGTNPLAADTDGDGFADGTEVAAGTDPKNGSESPDGHLTAYFAVELEFFTLSGKNYQLQQSIDLQTWSNVGDPFAGSGNLASRFVSTRTSEQTYWRLQPVP